MRLDLIQILQLLARNKILNYKNCNVCKYLKTTTLIIEFFSFCTIFYLHHLTHIIYNYVHVIFSATHMAESRHANKLIPLTSPTVGWVKIRNNVITSRHNEDLACKGNFCKCLNTSMPAESTKAECDVHSFPVRHETRL